MKRIIYIGNYHTAAVSKCTQQSADDQLDYILIDDLQKLDVLLTDNVELILTDFRFNSTTWSEVLLFINKNQLDIPFLVLATSEAENTAVEVFRSGASDYIAINEIVRLDEFVERHLMARERRRTAKASETEMFKTLIEHSADGVVILDEVGSLKYASPSVKNILGYEVEDILNFTLLDYVHPDDKAAVIEKMQEFATNPGVTIKGQTARIRHKSGEWRWIEAIGTNMSEFPHIQGIVDHFRDVTDRVNNEILLKQSEGFIADIFRTLTSHIAVLDEYGNIIAVNKAWNDFAIANGENSLLSTSEGANYLAACKPAIEAGDEYAIKACEGINEVMKGASTFFQMEYPCNSTTEDRWFIMRVNRFKNDSVKIVVAHDDISDRRLAEENLKLSELKFRSLLDQSIDGMALLGADMKTQYIAPSIERILGFTEQEGLEMDIVSIAHPDDIPILIEVMEQAMANPGIPTNPKITRMRTKSGEYRFIEGTLTNLLHDPNINAIVDNFRDVTERKIAHDQLVYTTRLYSIITKVNQIIAHARDEYWLYEEVCSVAIELGGFDFAWIGLTNSTKRGIDMVASAGATEKDHSFFQDYIYEERGTINSVISGKSNFVIDAVKDVNSRSFLEYASERKFISSICLPIRKSGAIIGTFNLYSTEEHVFNDEETQLLTEITQDISYAIDVLEKERARKIAERRLEIENAKLKQAQSSANLGTWEVDMETGSVTWSEELLKMYGLSTSKKHMSFDSLIAMIHPDDRQNVINARTTALETCKDTVISHRIIRTDGEVRNLISRIQFVFNNDGNAIAFLGLGQDITDQHEIMEALHSSELAFSQSESRYRQIVELANEGLCLLNDQNQIMFNNGRMSEMLGYSSSELVGQDLFSFLSKKDRTLEKRVDMHRKSGETDRIDLCFSSKSGKKVWTSVSISSIPGDKGELSKSIAMISNITDRHEGEQKNKFKAHLLNNIGQAIVATDKRGVVTFWNRAAETLFDLKASDVIGENTSDLIKNFGDHEKAKSILMLAKQGKEWSGDVELLNSDGFPSECATKALPLLDENNKVDGLICITTDVSEQKRLEKVLYSAARLAKLGHFEYNLITGKIYWSDLTKEIHEVDGYYEPHIATALTFFKEGYSRTTITKAMQLAIENGLDWDLELQIVTFKGNEIWIRTSSQIERREGRIIRIYGIIQDINSMKLSEKAALDALQDRNAILESIGEAFFATDQNGAVTYWNTNAERLLGKERGDIIGKHLWDVYPEYIGSKTFNNYNTAIATQKSIGFEDFYYTFEKWLEVSIFPSEFGLSIYFKDITERKLAELHLMELNETLQAHTKDLIVVNRELEQFSYIVSHNLRAPVANIIGLAEELSDESYDPETKLLFTDSLKISASMLNEVITDLNSVVQIKNEVTHRKEIVNLDQLTQTILATINHIVVKDDVQVICDFAKYKELLAAKSYLHSIIYNLISNAIKYKRHSVPPVIHIESIPFPDGVEIKITDNGMGIDLEKKSDEIFKMYKRFHSHVEGKGIGLFMVKTQVEILGGTISVESEVGKGSVFRVFVPQ